MILYQFHTNADACRLSPVVPEKNECAESEHGSEQVKDTALLRWVALCEKVSEWQEHEADNEIRDPCTIHE